MFPKPGRRRKNKFNNTILRDPVTGKKAYDSQLERDYHRELALLEKAGEVTDVRQWPSVELLPGIRYKPDFYFVDADGRSIWVDCKGVMGQRYNLIKKIWKLFGPGVLLEVHRGTGFRKWICKEIQSQGRKLS